MKNPFKLARAETTFEVTPEDQLPVGARKLPVSLVPVQKHSRQLLWVVASICLCFLVTRLDAFTSSSTVRSTIITLLDSAALYDGFFPERLWTPITCMWLHGSLWHIANNMLMMVFFCYFLRKAFRKEWWLMFFLVGGAIGNLTHLLVHNNPAADFANWQGTTLVSIFYEPNTPLAGASGGVFALHGAAIAVALRYLLLRKSGVRNHMGMGILWLLLPALYQFFFIDWGNASIAGLAHQVGMAAGFVLGLLPPIKGNVSVLASKQDVVGVGSLTVKGKDNAPIAVDFYLKSEFDAARDFVLLEQEQVDWRGGRKSYHYLLAGSAPAEGDIQCFRLADSNEATGYRITKVPVGDTEGSPKKDTATAS